MKTILRWLVVVALAGGTAWAVTAWPHINEVESGRTPEYPDLQVRTYSASPQQVSEAAREALSHLPRWTVVGSGEGPAGSVVSAVHETRLFRFKDDVTVKITRKGSGTEVSFHSRSRVGSWDFGQNARNIRELQAALDARLR